MAEDSSYAIFARVKLNLFLNCDLKKEGSMWLKCTDDYREEERFINSNLISEMYVDRHYADTLYALFARCDRHDRILGKFKSKEEAFEHMNRMALQLEEGDRK